MSDKFVPKIRKSQLTAAGSKKFATQDQGTALIPFQITEKISASAAASVTLDQKMDPNCLIDCIVLRANGAVTAATATGLGVGDGTTTNRFARVTISGSLNTPGDVAVRFGPTLAGAANGEVYLQGGNIVIAAVANDGTAAGTFTTTDLDVVIIGRRFVGFSQN